LDQPAGPTEKSRLLNPTVGPTADVLMLNLRKYYLFDEIKEGLQGPLA
jgi:hypothetical protein